MKTPNLFSLTQEVIDHFESLGWLEEDRPAFEMKANLSSYSYGNYEEQLS